MKYIDYAAMGAAFSASQRASEAFEEIERLQNQIDSMNLMRWDDREEREFQKWIEEFIYQFGKTIGRIETNPGGTVQDFQEVGAYLKMVEEKRIDTSAISGLENKKVFEDVLTRAELLFGNLWKNPEVVKQRNLWLKEEAEEKNRLAILEKERFEYANWEVREKRRGLMVKNCYMGVVAFLLVVCMVIAWITAGEEVGAKWFWPVAVWCGIWYWAYAGWRQE